MDFQDFRDFRDFPDFLDFCGVPEVREAFRKLPGAGALHPDQIWTHIKPYGPHSCWFFKILLIFDATPSMIFSNYDAQVASTRPGTHLKRWGSKFYVGWWSGHLHSSHMDPIGEKTTLGTRVLGYCLRYSSTTLGTRVLPWVLGYYLGYSGTTLGTRVLP